MLDISAALLILFIGLVSGFLDSIIGAGGLISVPSLIFLGMPPQIAIATDRLGTIGGSITSLIKFWKAKKIAWKHVPVLSVIALLGSVIGADILLNVDAVVLQIVVGILLLILLPFIFLKRKIGIKHVKTGKFRIILGLLVYFLIMIFGGFFGQGTGPLMFYSFTFFLGFTMIEVLATGTIPWIVLSISSVIIFALNGIVNYEIGAVLLIGMAVGGYLGACVAVKKGEIWIKYLFMIFVVIFAVKLLFF